MNIINKFKVNYKIKLLDDYMFNNKKSEVYSLFYDLKNKNKDLFFQIMSHFIIRYKKHVIKDNLFKNKIVLINSFEIDDCKYLSEFFLFYFSKLNLDCEHNSLSNAIVKDLESLKLSNFPKKIEFQEFVEFSEFFFNSMLINPEQKNLFLNSNSAFFEAGENNFFIYPNTTANYFLIHKDPLHTYASLKKKLTNSQDALNTMFNFQNTLVNNQDIKSEYEIKENRQSWNIYLNSWKDPNVISTYRGLLIPQKDLISAPYETLTKAIFHLIESGIKIDMNYDLIDEYIQGHQINEENISVDISNKEKKLLLNNLDPKLLEYFHYQF